MPHLLSKISRICIVKESITKLLKKILKFWDINWEFLHRGRHTIKLLQRLSMDLVRKNRWREQLAKRNLKKIIHVLLWTQHKMLQMKKFKLKIETFVEFKQRQSSTQKSRMLLLGDNSSRKHFPDNLQRCTLIGSDMWLWQLLRTFISNQKISGEMTIFCLMTQEIKWVQLEIWLTPKVQWQSKKQAMLISI
jgi:hypothetical protein